MPSEKKKQTEKTDSDVALDTILKTLEQQTNRIENMHVKFLELEKEVKANENKEKSTSENSIQSRGSGVKTEPSNGNSTGQNFEHSNLTSPHEPNTNEIYDLTRPTFKNNDTMSKVDLDRMLKIRQSQLSKIPVLDDVKNNDLNGLTTNFPEYKEQLLKYYGLFDKTFLEWIKIQAAAINIDEAATNPKFKFPQLPAEFHQKLTTIDLIEMTDATSKVSKTYSFLLSDVGPADVVKAFFAVYVYMQPNSMDTRNQSLKTFFTRELPVYPYPSLLTLSKKWQLTSIYTMALQ